jgi:hypothetical protein
MKRFLIGLTLLACSFSALAHPNTINLLAGTYGSAAGIYNFSAGSTYAPYYGTGTGIVYGETLSAAYPYGYNLVEAWVGTTVGNITPLRSNVCYLTNFSGTFSNATFNSKTDTLTGVFVGSEFINGKWSPFTGHITGTFAMNGPTYSYGAHGVTRFRAARSPVRPSRPCRNPTPLCF